MKDERRPGEGAAHEANATVQVKESIAPASDNIATSHPSPNGSGRNGPAVNARPLNLDPGHWRELVDGSGIDPAVVSERGYRTLYRPSAGDDAPRRELRRLGIPGWAVREDADFPVLVIPLYGPTGELASHQAKPRRPVSIGGKARKYAATKGQPNRLDVHPRNVAKLSDPTVELWITEGTKKADSLTSRGACAVAISGVFNWRSRIGTIGDFEDVVLKGRVIMVCFDSDTRTNKTVLSAMERLGRWLRSKGAKEVRYCVVPSAVGDAPTKGCDDYFVAGGTLEGLRAAATSRPPKMPEPGNFTDAVLARDVSKHLLDGNFVWCAGLGWLAYDGRRWNQISDQFVAEVLRDYTVWRWQTAAICAKDGDDPAVKGWHSMLAAAKRKAVLGDCKGVMERSVHAFDRDPDLLNTPEGVVDLRTGDLFEHDADLMMTKMAAGSYQPGYTHPDWTAALEALPVSERDWFQVRVGQAITGHPTPDGILVVMQGSGDNGKSLLVGNGLIPGLGDYASTASSKLLQSDKNEHSTEKAALRGQRFLIAEEMTEGRALNVTVMKQVQDVAEITARLMHQNNMTFKTTHSLFTTTNYRLIVNEVDHGTWRRLALLRFPFFFRKQQEWDSPGFEPNSLDRLGDMELKDRLARGATGQRDAVVTWAVAGAIRWYADRQRSLALTPRILADTHAWRCEADRALGYWTERLIPDANACVAASELAEDFNRWLTGNGHTSWSKTSFHSRFRDHGETIRHRVTEDRPKSRPDRISRPDSGDYSGYGTPLRPPDLPQRPVIYRGVRYRTSADRDVP